MSTTTNRLPFFNFHIRQIPRARDIRRSPLMGKSFKPKDETLPPGHPPEFQLHKILWIAVSSIVGLRVERRYHLQSVYLQDVVSVDRTHKNRLGLSLLVSATASTLQTQNDEMITTFQHEVLLWMRQQPKEFYAAGIEALIKRWDKCISIGGDYVEK
ncbi:hypothetical protein AVEN_111288-1 [Araneus ventricosus]|uniref:Uncharacterized protein n=1 Tax=Araneus ventricosus TaxID=182803 RepID=A0A4Y2FHE9_ARAVE|nr:hypothetical protein AVEN_111288-1 [Araneus ventricosus]